VAQVRDDFDVALPRANLDRLQAAIAVVTTDRFFQSVDRFIEVANVLAGSAARPGVFDPADAVECAWAVAESFLLHPPDADEPEPFSDDVRAYVGQVLRSEGFLKPPAILRFALAADRTTDAQYVFGDDPANSSVPGLTVPVGYSSQIFMILLAQTAMSVRMMKRPI
jgi:hypothetical protein